MDAVVRSRSIASGVVEEHGIEQVPVLLELLSLFVEACRRSIKSDFLCAFLTCGWPSGDLHDFHRDVIAVGDYCLHVNLRLDKGAGQYLIASVALISHVQVGVELVDVSWKPAQP